MKCDIKWGNSEKWISNELREQIEQFFKEWHTLYVIEEQADFFKFYQELYSNRYINVGFAVFTQNEVKLTKITHNENGEKKEKLTIPLYKNKEINLKEWIVK